MNYSELREIALSHIQDLAGKLWTDYNTHDPGITMLEVLCYAITDLGHRVNQDIADILTGDPEKPESADIKNFFSAAQILPNKPLTLNDLRKLIIDVSVYDEPESGCDFVGVKNAWINLSNESEIPVWAYRGKSELSYDPKPDEEPIDIRPLYNVLLEFETCEAHGDLNQHIVSEAMQVTDPGNVELEGLEIRVEAEFARWDDMQIKWSEPESIRRGIRELDLRFLNKPPRYSFDYEMEADNRITLSGSGPGSSGLSLESLSEDLNDFIDQMVLSYSQKVEKIHEIVRKVKSRLHANRNLCEDYFRLSALKVEEIAVCADIELELEADVEEVQAQIYHQISTFLAPSVNFYSLPEMMDIGVATEKIFEGPLLDHGFISESELKKSDRREAIYVSDLVQIIMNIEGVAAVKHIEIANLPQGNEEEIPSRSVKWCLELAHEYNYVPRLSTSDSKITFYKEQLPYQARQSNVEDRIRELKTDERSQKNRNPVLDLSAPRGRYLDLGQYSSIQEEFPSTYGVGTNGLPPTASKERKGKTKQLKGFLMFFEQLLADYLAQLDHVKELFSMNAEKDEEGEYKIGRTYYTQPLNDRVPDAEPLYADIDEYPTRLNQIAESPELFNKRRNRFLDHLMARFSEQFTDYATLTYRLAGMEGKRDLIQDKLTLLNSYPEISSGRGEAFNYQHPCRLWHADNKSGLEKRAALQVGIDEIQAANLVFTEAFTIIENDGDFGFEITGSGGEVLLQNPIERVFDNEEEASEAIEELIINGVIRENYIVREDDGTYSFTLECSEKPIAVSSNDAYGDETEAEDAIGDLINIFEDEFYTNHESNRNNFTAPVENYFNIQTQITGKEYKIEYTLYEKPFSTDSEDALLTGEIEGEAEAEHLVEEEADERAEEFIWEVISNGGRKDQYTLIEENGDGGKLRLNGRFSRDLGRSVGSERTAEELAAFFSDRFFNKEGLHLVEHILLRPRYNEHVFIPANHETLKDPDDLGEVKFKAVRDIVSTVMTGSKVRVGEDISAELSSGMALTIEGTENNDGGYQVNSFEYKEEKGYTEIKVSGGSLETVSEPGGKLIYTIRTPVKSVDPENRILEMEGKVKIDEGDEFQIEGSAEDVNDGTFRVESAGSAGSGTQLVIRAREEWIQDRLIPIQIDPDCEHCQLENPYSYVATVVLPYWQGRFGNMDFRKFFERKIRFEAPAHIFLKICWVSNKQMREFEKCYKKWQVENARNETDKAALSSALNDLIDILYRLRNVYPVGRLHDCEEAETLEESMILNNTILGSA
ncbi:MAG: hypothetical protein WD035_00565 [Balneolaceae bacterium]